MLLSKELSQFTFLPAVYNFSSYFIYSPILDNIRFDMFAKLVWNEVTFLFGFNLHFLLTIEIERHFNYTFTIHFCSLVKCLFMKFLFLLLIHWCSSYILDTYPFLVICVTNINSQLIFFLILWLVTFLDSWVFNLIQTSFSLSLAFLMFFMKVDVPIKIVQT